MSLCLCKKKMSNPSTTTCQDVTHFFFVRWHSLCVWLYVLCAFGSLCDIHNVPYPSAAARQDVPSFRCQIFCQVTYCVCDCIFIVCIWVLVLVKMSHPSAAACQDVPSFARWPTVCLTVCLVCNWVLVLVRMSHLSAAACQDVPSFVR